MIKEPDRCDKCGGILEYYEKGKDYFEAKCPKCENDVK